MTDTGVSQATFDIDEVNARWGKLVGVLVVQTMQLEQKVADLEAQLRQFTPGGAHAD